MSAPGKIYSAPWWLRGAHAQTVWGKLIRRRRELPLHARSVPTPDADEIELYSLSAAPYAPHLLMLHGLEGSLRSHYVIGILTAASAAGFNAHVMMFRSCGARLNRTARFYHSGDTEDVRLVIDTLSSANPDSSLFVVGVSLGGNVLLKYLGEAPGRVSRGVVAAAAISVPYDLERSAVSINRGFSKVYQRFFLQTLKQKLAAKRDRFPNLPSAQEAGRLRSMVDFDDVVTAPLHGFLNARDYYRQSSAISFLKGIAVPTLLLSAFDDPFLPPDALATVALAAKANRALQIEFYPHGGHAGFVSGPVPWRAEYFMERRVIEFFNDHRSNSARESNENG